MRHSEISIRDGACYTAIAGVVLAVTPGSCTLLIAECRTIAVNILVNIPILLLSGGKYAVEFHGMPSYEVPKLWAASSFCFRAGLTITAIAITVLFMDAVYRHLIYDDVDLSCRGLL